MTRACRNIKTFVSLQFRFTALAKNDLLSCGPHIWLANQNGCLENVYHLVYLVNKPLSVPGIPEDNAQGPKNEQLAEKRSFEGNCEILRRIFQPRALSSDIPASPKGVYLSYNPPNNFSRRTHVGLCCIFCGFFDVSKYGIVNQLFIYLALASAKSIFLFPLTT